jgi:hypothetical protein
VDIIKAHGPDELIQSLEGLYERANRDARFAAQPHYVLFQIGQQSSLLRFDIHKRKVYHFNIDGYAATAPVKVAVQQFLEKAGGTLEADFHDISREEMIERNKAFLAGDTEARVNIHPGRSTLRDAQHKLDIASAKEELHVAKKLDHFGVFHRPGKHIDQPQAPKPPRLRHGPGKGG